VIHVDEYARIARLYDAVVGPFLRPVYRGVLDELPRTGRVLDLCCGTGALTALAAERTGDAVGVDNSPAMIARAAVARPGVEFIRADATRLPFGERGFDAVVLSFALHEKETDTGRAMLREARRVLGPDGLLLVADYRAPRTVPGLAARQAVALVERMAGKQHFAHYRQYMRTGGSRAFLERAGFSPDLAATFLFGCAGLYVAGT
jgi:ubiquinone/menaquinone biosynthesis C-methylase UbiE